MFLNFVYGIVLLLCSPLLIFRALRHGKYRQGWAAKFLGQVDVPPAAGPRFWFHAVSVGEVNLMGGLVRQLLEQLPGADIVISTTTSTGFELAQKRFPKERVFYCPLDFTWSVRRALDRIRPECIVLAELEVWPNWIRAAHQRSIPVVVVNGRLSQRSFRGYQRVDYLVHSTFKRLSLVAAQNKTYADRFIAMGTPASVVHVTGSTKFDDAPLSRDNDTIRSYRSLLAMDPSTKVWIAGSTQAGEETIVLNAYRQLVKDHPHLRLIIVPRHAERFDQVAREIEQSEFQLRRRTQLNQPLLNWPQETVVLIDSIGELRSWWGLADVAFVGGSLGNRGGQNMLEPAGYGAAVCFGPNTQNFRDIALDLIQHRAAVVVADETEMVAFVKNMLQSPHEALLLGENAQRLIQQHQGATRRTIDLVVSLCLRRAARLTTDPNAQSDQECHN